MANRSNSNTTSADTDNRTKRPKRIPLHDQRNTLTVKNGRDDLVYRFVNDTADRIQRFRTAGWEHVSDESVEVGDYKVEKNSELGNIICKQVNRDGTVAYLMCIPKELYEEDQLVKQQEADRLEEAMEEETKNAAEGRYGSMKVSVSR